MDEKSARALYRSLEQDYFGENMQEREEVESFGRVVRGSSFFVDAGASLGQYARAADQILEGGRIVCIEADSLRYRRLSELIAEWQGNSKNRLEAMHAAVSNENGTATFYETGEELCGGLHHYWGSEEFPAYDAVKPTPVEVRCVTLDSLFHANPPDLIKIDVEGAEYRAVLGASELLRMRKTRFAVEMHPWGDRTLNKKTSDVFQLFQDHGYDFRRLYKLWYFFPKRAGLLVGAKFAVAKTVMDSDRLRKTAKRVLKRARSFAQKFRQS